MAAYNFPNSPSDGDTVTSNGITYTYSSSKTRWDGAAASGSSTTVYATIDDLPLSGASTGDQAYVSGNRLYIWNGTGWYNIALINTTPSISGASASYTLATDGTATTVTITATDPEGIPIVYSIASDTSGNVATVTQGTGASANVFTITPSTNSANAGTFSLTFRASDGVNIATAVSSFTLVFTVQNSNYTTALITSVGANNAVKNSFDDASTNNHTITASGNVTQNTFSPYRHGGYSALLGSNTAYLRTPTDARYDIGGTGDWSYEAWVYVPTSHTFASYARVFGMGPYYIDSKSFGVFLSDTDSSGKMAAYWHDGSIGRKLTSTTAFDKGKWNHIAVCRTGNDIALYYNGTRIAHNSSYTASISTGNTYLFSGGTGNGTEGFNGYIRDVHFVNGSHGYDASSASLTVPTEKISAITNTKYLGSQEPYLNDNSTHDVSLTVSGTVETEPFGPYDYSPYSSGSNGGSMYFDGNGDRLYVASDASLQLGGSSAFTAEFWIYIPAVNSDYSVLLGKGLNTGTAEWYLELMADGQIDLFLSNNGTNYNYLIATVTSTLKVNNWHHIAFVRENTSTIKVYTDGVQTYLNSSVANWNTSTGIVQIGGYTDGSSSLWSNCYMSNVRIVKGTAVYTSNFTPPTAPLTAITNTQLLVNGTNAGIIDKSQSVKTITLNGDVKSSTTQSKYLTSSMYFDGTGDSLTIGNNQGLHIGSGDFTIEMWFRAAAVNTNQTLMLRRSAVTARGFVININSSSPNKLGFVAGDTDNAAWEVALTSTSDLSADTWHHAAIVRSGNNFYLFLDGTQEATASSTVTIADDTSNLIIADNDSGSGGFTGYLSDLRITKGLARYTANFTPPTAALQG